MADMKPRSRDVTDGIESAGARAMLRAVGMTDADWGKAQVGVASSWNEVTPCNMPLDRLAKRAKDGVRDAGGYPLEFVTIAISDGISMGHEGMRGSLPSREIIADSVECVMHSERLDALVTLAGCDKSLPGMLMAAARLNLPSAFLYGGSILPGSYKNQAIDLVNVFEGIGACAAGMLTENELGEIERHACPTIGSCAGMFTANTMASAAEALGMALPGSSTAPAVDARRDDFAFETGRAVMGLLEAGIRPRQIMTKEAFENAIAVGMALGGSTNLVLHLLAIAHEAHVELELDDFNRVGAKVPHIADMKPHGKYHMTDLDRIGGVQVVMRELLDSDERISYDGLMAHGLESIVSRFIVRRDGRYQAVTYLYPQQTADIDVLRRIVHDVDPGLRLTGLPAINHELRRQFFPQFLKGIAIGTAAVALIIYVVFRTVRYTLLALLPTALGFVWSAGVLALLRVQLDLFSLFAAVTFIGIAVDYGIYVLYRYVFEPSSDMGDVITKTGPAIIIACATALIGFGTLINSSYGPLHVFGIVSIVTLTCCLTASIVFLPALVLEMERWSRSAR